MNTLTITRINSQTMQLKDLQTHNDQGKMFKAFNLLKVKDLDILLLRTTSKFYAVRFGKGLQTKKLQDSARTFLSELAAAQCTDSIQ